MEIVDNALHALSDEVLVPHSGWERGSNGAGGGEENCKPRHLEWETALTNTAGCLRYGHARGRSSCLLVMVPCTSEEQSLITVSSLTLGEMLALTVRGSPSSFRGEQRSTGALTPVE